ncbi:hypothetical protein N7E81_01050 [Reichenbachiella carrageenanivorans]|uniref:Nuclear transport factor 2 family protein n=1 Tax=Reichenbachiella carrageenanivorans TaxID=2979869 RepID=A0ABY6D3L7_9BACT|nr:hypothetical protein [Reichenbachiella carrageenanivorans]UXX79698.1 hypothetical protein N7E81_01050 [Reichenbachiella carrageenanivorans]
MSKQFFLFFMVSLWPMTTWGQDPYAQDVTSEDAIVNAVYETISGPKGERRNWDRMRYLMAPGARFIPTRPSTEGKRVPCFLTLDEFIAQGDEWLMENGFFESEISRRSETFGLITHVWSTYASRWIPDEEPFARGINSLQLMNDGERWWIINLYWAAETEENPLPKKYLK